MSLVTGGQHCCLHEGGGARQLLCGGSCPESLALPFSPYFLCTSHCLLQYRPVLPQPVGSEFGACTVLVALHSFA